MTNITSQITKLPTTGLRNFLTGATQAGRLSGSNSWNPSDLAIPERIVRVAGHDICEFTTPIVQAVFGGGPVVTDASLALLFWGNFWQTAASPSMGEVVEAVQTIVASPYLSELSQYGFHSLTMAGAWTVITPSPPSGTYSAQDVTNMVQALIDDGHFPEPDEPSGNIIYMVFAPLRASYTGNPPGQAAHTSAKNTEIDPDRVKVGWINYNDLESLTVSFTHELVEIITDPEPHSGWTVTPGSPGLDEFADICPAIGICDNFEVTSYFSAERNKCIVPCQPLHRHVDLSSQEKILSYGERSDEDDTTASRNSKCFKGSYHWWLWSQSEQLTLTPDTSSYGHPNITWVVNGVPLVSGALTLPVDNYQDPLNDLHPLPAEDAVVAASIDLPTGTLTFTTREGNGPVAFEVAVTVTDNDLRGYETSRTVSDYVYLSGRVRQMDARYTTDKNDCIAKYIQELQSLIVQSTRPFVDKGDPIPPWVQRELAAIEAEIGAATQKAVRLVRLVDSGKNPTSVR